MEFEEVKKIAALARLNLTAEEVAQMAFQMNDILKYVERLSGLNLDEVEPLSHPLPMVNVTRQDTPDSSLAPDEALKGAPDRQEFFFRVPRILE